MTVLWIVLAVLLIWLMLSEVPAGWDGHAPLPYLIAFTPFLWIPAAALAIIGAVRHEWAFAVCALITLLAAGSRKVLYWLNDIKAPNTAQMIADKIAAKKAAEAARKEAAAHRSDAGAAKSRDKELATHGKFTVMTLNCRFGRASAEAIVAAVRERDVAVLALQELDDALVAALDEAGLSELLPYRQLGEARAGDNGGFNGIWIRVEPETTAVSAAPIPAADVPSVTLPVTSTRGITFLSAHTKSPMRGCRDWSAGIVGLGEVATAVHKNNGEYERPSLTTYTGKLKAEYRGPVSSSDFSETEISGAEVSNTEISPAQPSSDTAAGSGTDANNANADNGIQVATISARDAGGTQALSDANRVHLDPEAVQRAAQLAAAKAFGGTLDPEAAEERGERPAREMIAVVMGDLNASIAHPSFRKLLAAGFDDATLVEAKGEHPTFASWLPWPRLVLDHILYTGFLEPSGVDAVTIDGSDHLALTATLTLTDGKQSRAAIAAERADAEHYGSGSRSH